MTIIWKCVDLIADMKIASPMQGHVRAHTIVKLRDHDMVSQIQLPHMACAIVFGGDELVTIWILD